VLLSEAMLQQTQVSRVIERYEQFLARFPDAPTMSAAPLADVLDAWAGLGYYRRARDLHRAATVITEQHGGDVPEDLASLTALPGVGPYTARAVLAFAFEHDHGVVDTNAARVLARAFSGTPMGAAAVQRLADRIVPVGDAWVHNQSMLDLGATVCTARSPRCTSCPLAADCAWLAASADSAAEGGEGGEGGGGEAPTLPDPARTTAGTSRAQARFAGSDREGRGRILAALREGASVARSELDAVTRWGDVARSRRVAEALVADGLAAWDGERLRAAR
jgi:A/G-specific adenine glycosylase